MTRLRDWLVAFLWTHLFGARPAAQESIPMAETKGVAFNPPPDVHMGDILASVQQAVSQLPPEKKVAFVTIANEKGVNAALVEKLPHGWNVQTWIGKTWTGPIGAGATVTWSR